MSDAGWAILVFMAVIIMASAPDLIWMGGLVLIGVASLKRTHRALDEGREPPTISEMIEELFSKKDR